MSGHVVTAPLVVAKVDGHDRYLYDGAPVPDGVDETWLADMVDMGLVAPVDDIEAQSEPPAEPAPVLQPAEPEGVAP